MGWRGGRYDCRHHLGFGFPRSNRMLSCRGALSKGWTVTCAVLHRVMRPNKTRCGLPLHARLALHGMETRAGYISQSRNQLKIWHVSVNITKLDGEKPKNLRLTSGQYGEHPSTLWGEKTSECPKYTRVATLQAVSCQARHVSKQASNSYPCLGTPPSAQPQPNRRHRAKLPIQFQPDGYQHSHLRDPLSLSSAVGSIVQCGW